MKFLRFPDKEQILEHRDRLAQCGVTVREDFCPETLALRASYHPKIREARGKGMIAYVKYRKLVTHRKRDNFNPQHRSRHGSGNGFQRQSSDAPWQQPPPPVQQRPSLLQPPYMQQRPSFQQRPPLHQRPFIPPHSQQYPPLPQRPPLLQPPSLQQRPPLQQRPSMQQGPPMQQPHLQQSPIADPPVLACIMRP